MCNKKEIDKKIEEFKDQDSFRFYSMDLETTKYFSSLLKDLKFTRLILSGLPAEHLKYITESLKGNTIIKDLLIGGCDMEKSARYVAGVLKYSVIKYLRISHSNIGDVAAKYLAQGLKESQLIEVDLSFNQIGDDGLKFLADPWKDGKVFDLNLYNNKITVKAWKTLREMLKFTGERYIKFNLYDPINKINYLNMWKCNSKYPCICIEDEPCDRDTAEFISKTFDEIIIKLEDIEYFKDGEIRYFKEAIKMIALREVEVYFTETNTDVFRDIFEIFENYPIHKLTLIPHIHSLYYVKQSKISLLQAEYVKKIPILADILNSSNIKHLSIRMNPIIINHCIKHLVNATKNTQVTHLTLNTILDEKTANDLAEIIQESQLVSINFSRDPAVNVPTQRYLNSLSKNRETAHLISSNFANLVALNLRNNEFEFTSPKDSGPLRNYVKFIKILCEKPNARTHLRDDRLEMEKIDTFVKSIEDHFNMFFNDNIVSLVERYEERSFIELVQEFHSANLGNIVKNLLLHRELFFIDDNSEILNPFIYKMLHMYKMPLYSELLEPNKKSDITKYYLKLPKMQDMEELLELLER